MPFVRNETFSVQLNQNENIKYQSMNKNSTNILPINVRPFYRDQRTQICRGHLYFGETSRSCKPWCKWPNKKNLNIHPSSRLSSPTPSRSSSPTNTKSSFQVSEN